MNEPILKASRISRVAEILQTTCEVMAETIAIEQGTAGLGLTRDKKKHKNLSIIFRAASGGSK